MAALAVWVVVVYIVVLASLGVLAARWGRSRWLFILAGLILTPALGFLLLVCEGPTRKARQWRIEEEQEIREEIAEVSA